MSHGTKKGNHRSFAELLFLFLFHFDMLSSKTTRLFALIYELVCAQTQKPQEGEIIMIHVRHVHNSDRDFWFSLDKHISESEFEKKINDKQGYVLFDSGAPIGLLRYNLFWDNVPFCTMLFIEKNAQKKGYGSAIMKFWEAEMKSLGFGMVMTSTQADEEAQHFYRKMGYRDSGGLLINIPSYEQPMEIFFTKALN